MSFSSHAQRSGFKQKLEQGQLVIGTWVNAIKDPMIMRILGGLDLDYVMIDMEHSGATLATVSEMCTLARECGLYPLVRPTDPNDLKMNGRLLDAGALGLVIPHIDTPQQAQKIANSMRFFDGGTRGYCSRIAGSGFEKMDEPAMRFFDKEVTCVVQFESVDAIRQANQILAVPGVDVAIVGRGDLAHSMGLSGNTSHPDVSALVETVYAAVRENHKVPGLLVNDLQAALLWLNSGIRFLTFSSEVASLISSYSSPISSIRSAYKR